MEQVLMGGKVLGVIAVAKPDHHFHLNHWTMSWNLESQPHSCSTQTLPDLRENNHRWPDTVAFGPFPTETPCADDGGNGARLWGKHMMRV